MFTSVEMFKAKLYSITAVFLLTIKVDAKPIYSPPQANQYVTGVQPMYSNLITPNVNPNYNYILPVQTYQQQIYPSPVYQPVGNQVNQAVSSQCCVKQYFNPLYKNLLDYFVKQYLQTGDPRVLLNFYQQLTPSLLPPLTLKVSKMFTPCINKMPLDFVGNVRNEAQVERNHDFGEKPARKSGHSERKTEIRTTLAATPSTKKHRINDKFFSGEEINQKLFRNQKIGIKYNKNTSKKSNGENKSSEMLRSTETTDNQMDESKYDYIVNELQKIRQKTNMVTSSSKKKDNDPTLISLDENNQIKSQKRQTYFVDDTKVNNVTETSDRNLES